MRNKIGKMKKILLLLMLAFGLFSVSAQDVIVKKDGSTVLCKIIGVNNNEVIFTKWSDVNGAQFIMDRSLISNINYQDGRQEKINEQTSNVYAPGIQQSGDTNFNDKALLKMDYERSGGDAILKKAKTMRIVGWTVGPALFGAGVVLTVVGGIEDGYLGLLIPGIVSTLGGIATTTVCLVKANQYSKRVQMMTTAPVFQHEFNFKDGSSLCAGVDMIRDKRFRQSTFGLGLQYNF